MKTSRSRKTTKRVRLPKKLVAAWSTLPSYRGATNVRVEWLIPYCGRDSEPTESQMMAPIPGEGFRADELEQLRLYLSHFKIEVCTLPVPWTGAKTQRIADARADFLRLEQTPGYPLPFRVWGIVENKPVPYPRVARRRIANWRVVVCSITGCHFHEEGPFAYYVEGHPERAVNPELAEELFGTQGRGARGKRASTMAV